jgi:peptidoglycan hydrolase-like protein with peptidoglycan-binding domain
MKTISLRTISIIFSFIISVCFITKIFAAEKAVSEPKKEGINVIQFTNYQKLKGVELIKMVQRVLKDSGFDPGPIDGILGPKTSAATKNYQIKNRLEPTGELDKQTLDHLFWSF